jgi:hypothetical protein
MGRAYDYLLIIRKLWAVYPEARLTGRENTVPQESPFVMEATSDQCDISWKRTVIIYGILKF